MSDDRQSTAEQYSFNLRGRSVPRSDPHSKRTKHVASMDRLLFIAQRSLDLDDHRIDMASAAERQVHVLSDEIAEHAQAHDDATALQDEIKRQRLNYGADRTRSAK